MTALERQPSDLPPGLREVREAPLLLKPLHGKKAQLSKYEAPTGAANRLSRITVRLMTATVRGRLI